MLILCYLILSFANNTITTLLVTSMRISTKEAKTGMKILPVIVGANSENVQII